DTVQLAVHDQGMGVPPEAREHLFDAFFRATNVGAISGTGLGLALVKLVVDLHNGKIEVDSREGEGSTFIITLPVKPAQTEKTTE
ncbi:MAG: sensor histidine kinase, partial [Phototrophicaceae bacterium]